MSDSTGERAVGDLFVVECPICRGHVAAAGSLRGRAACCPLCASLFQVPFPEPAPPPPSEPAGPPPRTDRSRSEPTATGLGEDWGPVIETLAPPQRTQEAGPGAAATSRVTFESPGGDQASADSPSAEPGPVEPPAAASPGEFPAAATASPLPRAGDLAFKEPVRTMLVGGEMIEIRRLSPEERRSRRFRRNLLMIVIGVSILLVIVALFGTPPRR
jgi:hypothetical protein